MSAPRYLDLPPALQAVWTATYATAVCASGILIEGDNTKAPTPRDLMISATAERMAWEAVRRANGGASPEPLAATTENPDPDGELFLAIEAVLVAFAERAPGGRLASITVDQLEALEALEEARAAVFGDAAEKDGDS